MPAAYPPGKLDVTVLDVKADPVISIDREGRGSANPVPFARGNAVADVILEEQEFTVLLRSGDPGADRITEYEVDFGDGTVQTVPVKTDLNLRVQLNDSQVIVFDKDGTRLLSYDFGQRLDVFTDSPLTRSRLESSLLGFAAEGGSVKFDALKLSQGGTELQSLLAQAFQMKELSHTDDQPPAIETLPFASTVFTVDVDNNRLLATGHGLSDGDAIVLSTDGVLPAPLTAHETVFVINSTANDFQVANTLGGVPLPILDVGALPPVDAASLPAAHRFQQSLSFKTVDIELNALPRPGEQVRSFTVDWDPQNPGAQTESFVLKGGAVTNVDVATERITVQDHQFVDGDRIVIRAGVALPGEILSTDQDDRISIAYFVVNATNDDFQVSLTESGDPVNIRTEGSGLTVRLAQHERLIASHVFRDGKSSHNVKVLMTFDKGPPREVILNTLAARRDAAENDLPSVTRTIRLPLLQNAGDSYQVDWGDGNVINVANPTPTYTYPQEQPDADANFDKLFDPASTVQLTDTPDTAANRLAPLVDFDFGRVMKLSSVRINYPTTNAPTQAIVKVGNGRGTFAEVGRKSSDQFQTNASGGTISFDLTGLTTQLLRLDFTDQSGQTIAINDVEFVTTTAGADLIRLDRDTDSILVTHTFTADPVQKANTNSLGSDTADDFTTVSDGLRTIVATVQPNNQVTNADATGTRIPIATLGDTPDAAGSDLATIMSTLPLQGRSGSILDVGLTFDLAQDGINIRPSVADDFEDELLDAATWIPITAGISQGNARVTEADRPTGDVGAVAGGRVELRQGGRLTTVDPFDPLAITEAPLLIEGQWTFAGLDNEDGLGGDTMKVLTRAGSVAGNATNVTLGGTVATGQVWTVSVGGTDFDYTTVAGDDLAKIATQLATAINATPGNLASADGNVLTISRVDGIALNVSTNVTLVGTVATGQVWTVSVGGTDFDYTAVAGDDLAKIATQLAAAINATPGNLASADGNVLTIRRVEGVALSVGSAAPTSATVGTVGTNATVTLGGTVAAGETWTVTVEATEFSVTVAAGNDLAAIATNLATEISKRAGLAATSAGAVITIGQTSGEVPSVSATSPQTAIVLTPPEVSTRALKVQGTITPGEEFIATINGSDFSYKAVTNDTATSVATGLAAQINAATGLGAAAEGDTLVIANAAGGAINLTYEVKSAASSAPASGKLTEPLTGILFSADSQTGLLTISAPGSAGTLSGLQTGNLTIAEGNTFNFSIIDAGASVSVMLSQVGNPQNMASASANVSSGGSLASNQVIFTNRESDTKVPRSYLEKVSIGFKSGIADDFSDGLVNPPGQSIWNPVTNLPELGTDISEIDGKLQLTQGGALVSVEQFNPVDGTQPLVVSGTWEFSNVGDASDLLRIFTRSSGTPVSEVMDLGTVSTVTISELGNAIADQQLDVIVGTRTFTYTVTAADVGAADPAAQILNNFAQVINDAAVTPAEPEIVIASVDGTLLKLVVLPVDGVTPQVSAFGPAGSSVTESAGARLLTIADVGSTVQKDDVWKVSVRATDFTHTVVDADLNAADPGVSVRTALATSINNQAGLVALTPGSAAVDNPTVTLSGPVATGQVWTINVSGTDFAYTAAAGDDLAAVAAGLATAIGADAALTATSAGNVVTIKRVDGMAPSVAAKAPEPPSAVTSVMVADDSSVTTTVTLDGSVATGQVWKLTVSDTDFEYTTVAGDDLAAVATKLATAIDADAALSATTVGNVVTISRIDGIDPNVVAEVPESSSAATSVRVTLAGSVEAGQVWTFDVAGTEFSYTTVAGDDPADVAAQLELAIIADPALQATSSGNELTISRADGEALIVSVTPPQDLTVIVLADTVATAPAVSATRTTAVDPVTGEATELRSSSAKLPVPRRP